MGADLCHQKHLFAAPVPERSAQDGLSLAVVILPSVVEKSNAGVYCLMDELHRLVQRRHIAEMMTTHPDSGDVHIRASKPPIDHVARLPRRCCRWWQNGGCGGPPPRTDFKKVPSSRIHLNVSYQPARMTCGISLQPNSCET